MDLPTCPACQQSVLDEDAVDCPFCGASMKGGAPSRAPAAAATKPAPPKSAPAKAAGTRSGSGEALKPPTSSRPVTREAAPPEKSTDAGDDDPFAVDSAAAAKAVAVSPKAAPGKTLEVKCPMCETVGYVSPKAAGQQIKCCNPKCLVPLFTAPAPPKKEAPPPPPPPSKSPVALYAGAGVALAAIGGFVLWKFVLSGGPTDERAPAPVNPIVLSGNPSKTTTPETNGSDDTKTPKTTDATPAVDPEVALIKAAIPRIEKLAFEAPQIRKGYVRRLAATAYISAGDLAAAKDQLEQLAKVAPQTLYEGCLPEIQLAWKQWASAPDKANASIAQAKTLFGKYTERGRGGVDASIALGAVLAATGKVPDAQTVVHAQRRTPEIEQLSALLQVVQSDGSWNLDRELIGRTVGGWSYPKSTAVVLILAAQGRWDEAQAWADAQENEEAAAEAICAWAEAYAQKQLAGGASADLQRAQAAANKRGPAVKARLFARLADLERAAGQTPAATKRLDEALALLKELPPPEGLKVNGAKGLLELKLPDPLPLRLAARAAADVAITASRLQKADVAWENFQLSLRYVRAQAPSLSFMQEKVAQSENDAEAIRSELKSTLRLRTEDEVRRRFTGYRQKCTDLQAVALRRFLAQSEVLQAAVRAGLYQRVAEQIEIYNNRPDIAERDPFLGSAVAVQVAYAYSAAGQQDRADQIYATAQEQIAGAFPEIQLQAIPLFTTQAALAGDLAGAKQKFAELQNESGVLHEASLTLACQLVNAGKLSEAYQLTSGLRDAVLREDGLSLISALATLKGKADDVAKIPTANQQPTEAASILSGMVQGLGVKRGARKKD